MRDISRNTPGTVKGIVRDLENQAEKKMNAEKVLYLDLELSDNQFQMR